MNKHSQTGCTVARIVGVNCTSLEKRELHTGVGPSLGSIGSWSVADFAPTPNSPFDSRRHVPPQFRTNEGPDLVGGGGWRRVQKSTAVTEVAPRIPHPPPVWVQCKMVDVK